MQNNPNYTQQPLYPGQNIQPPQGYAPNPTQPMPGQQFQPPQGFPQNPSPSSYPMNPLPGQQFQPNQGFPQNPPVCSYPTNPQQGFQAPQGFPQNPPSSAYPPNQMTGPQFPPPQGYPANQPINQFQPNPQTSSYGQQINPPAFNSGQQPIHPQGGFQNVPQFGQQGVPYQVPGQGINVPQGNKTFPAKPDLAAVPTLIPNLDSTAEKDATAIYKSYKGFGADWKSVMRILTHRTWSQRQKIKEEYSRLYKKCIIERTKSELADPVTHIAVALLHVGPDMDAFLLRKATKGLGTDESALTNILCTRSGSQIKAINESYQRLFKSTLLGDIKSDTSGIYEDLLCHLITVPREDNKPADRALAEKHTSELSPNKTVKTKPPRSLITILGTCSYEQIKLTMDHFKKAHGKSMSDWIKEHSNSHYQKALLSICNFVENPIQYFSNHLFYGIKDADFTCIIRVVCTRCEIDLASILKDYQKQNKKTVVEDINSAFGGLYPNGRECLQMLMGLL